MHFDSSAVKWHPWLTGFLVYGISVILLIKMTLKYFVCKVTACKGHCFLIRSVLSLPDMKKTHLHAALSEYSNCAAFLLILPLWCDMDLSGDTYVHIHLLYMCQFFIAYPVSSWLQSETSPALIPKKVLNHNPHQTFTLKDERRKKPRLHQMKMTKDLSFILYISFLGLFSVL